MDTAPIDGFDALYRDSPDPWGTQTRWYERRKRDLLMAALPRQRYASAYEAGCGTGHITRSLAPRCDSLLASDASQEAIALTKGATRGFGNVVVARHRLPEDWPRRAFDLVVLSELIYFVDATQCAAIADAARTSAGAHGLVVVCNWRAMIEGYGHTGVEAHARFEKRLDLSRTFHYGDADFILSGWSADTLSVAGREGLK